MSCVDGTVLLQAVDPFLDTEAEAEELGEKQDRQHIEAVLLIPDSWLGCIKLKMTIGADRGDKFGSGGQGAVNFFIEQGLG